MGYLRDELERLARERARPGRPPEPLPPEQGLNFLASCRRVILRLKAVDPDGLMAEVWRLERECDELGRELVDAMAERAGGMAGLVERIVADLEGLAGPGEGDALDVRPPRRGGDRR